MGEGHTIKGREITIRLKQRNHQEKVEAASIAARQGTLHAIAPSLRWKIAPAIGVERQDIFHHSAESRRERLFKMKTIKKKSGGLASLTKSKMWMWQELIQG